MSNANLPQRWILAAGVGALLAGAAALPALAQGKSSASGGVGIGLEVEARSRGSDRAAEAKLDAEAKAESRIESDANGRGRSVEATSKASSKASSKARTDVSAESEAEADVSAEVVLDPDVSASLVAMGWGDARRAGTGVDAFANHGERVRTYVQIAKELGYDASVGARLANLNYALEADVEAEVAVSGTARARIQEIRAALETETDLSVRAQLIQELHVLLGLELPTEATPWLIAEFDADGDFMITANDLAEIRETKLAADGNVQFDAEASAEADAGTQ